MSEFKYACPVCGQHIQCDSAHSGSVMECPTCFQKITAPRAPATADQKLILSGKKADVRPVAPAPSGLDTPLRPPRPGFPIAALALLVLVVFAGGLAILLRHRLGPNPSPATVLVAAVLTNSTPAPEVAQTTLPGDTRWMLDLANASFPDTKAAGRIHGQDFVAERAVLSSGTLTLRAGAKGSVAFGLVINFSGVQAEVLAGKTINVTSNAPLAARVTLHWQEGDQALKDTFETAYALRLQFGGLDNNRISGSIYFCAPDEAKSYVAGTFVAEVRRPKPVKPKQ